MDLDHYLSSHFESLSQCKPLFYSWDIGIRFELGAPPVYDQNKSRYMQGVYDRAILIYEHLHQRNDKLLLVTNAHFGNQTTVLKRAPKLYRRYIPDKGVLRRLQHKAIVHAFADSKEIDDNETNWFTLECHGRDITYRGLIKAICNHDVGIKPSIFHDVFFINVTTGTIFHIYDDRGCDVISASKDALMSIYEKYNDWILDYDRAWIDETFNSGKVV
ncbi:DUF3885 domain-containing protein [Paenibacillus sp. CAU 1782]